MKTYWQKLVLILVVATLLYFSGDRFYQSYRENLNSVASLRSGNGRIEATEIDIATQIAGRVAEIMVDEGDLVYENQPLARMDDRTLQAQLERSQAQQQQAANAVKTAQANAILRDTIETTIQAMIKQREAEAEAATAIFRRTEELAKRNVEAAEKLDQDRAGMVSAKAALDAAISLLPTVKASIGAARSQVTEAQSALQAAQASVNEVQVQLDEATIRAPRSGRIQFRIAQAGEVLPIGGKVLSLVDLTDVSMTFFLPAQEAGRLKIGQEARLVFDAAPDLVIPARIAFVASVAQFTPKTVETADERSKLMFRIKAKLSPELLQKHMQYVKTGVPGMAYVKLNDEDQWPDTLKIRLPE
jgi:HlyD family secretion protein